MAIRYALRPYQAEIGKAVMDSVLHRRGLTFTVEIARQGGKNELSAQLEVLLLTLHMAKGGNLVKCAPTFVPQVVVSMQRLKERLNDAGLQGLYRAEHGYALRLGEARLLFFSAEPSARVVGATAHHLLEVDEAQEVAKEKFYKEFRPMGASTNVTTVLYGTPWDSSSLLEESAVLNRELERRDGLRRHFAYDWQVVAQHNPAYLAYVEAERQRLGEDHPLFLTQYALQPLRGGGGFLSPQQQAQLQGRHPRRRQPEPGKVYVAGVDLAGGPQGDGDSGQRAEATRDATVVTVGELEFPRSDDLFQEPQVRVVEQYAWVGVSPHQLYPRLVDVLKEVWRCRRVVVDATGLGAPLASFLAKALGLGVEAFIFTAQSKSRLGFDLLAAINSGRLKMYAPDGSEEFQELWRQVDRTRAHYRPDRTMSFSVDPAQGHDDYVMSLALVVRAGSYLPRTARGRAPAPV